MTTQNATEVAVSSKLILTSTYVSYDPHTAFAWEAASTTDGSEVNLEHGVTTATPVNIDNLVLKGHILEGGSRYASSAWVVEGEVLTPTQPRTTPTSPFT